MIISWRYRIVINTVTESSVCSCRIDRKYVLHKQVITTNECAKYPLSLAEDAQEISPVRDEGALQAFSVSGELEAAAQRLWNLRKDWSD